jgi:2-dehydro-3-deoxyphosphooctonate aldolase (KDO 8-P synthase)
VSIIHVGEVTIGAGRLALIAGPCVLEDEMMVLSTAERLARLRDDLHIPVIFKSSYEKDNRSTVRGYRGPGLAQGLLLLDRVRQAPGLPVLSDVHREADVAEAAAVLDMVQIPAFLCRQTSLLLEVGKHARAANLKKGQFVAPADMAGSVEKLRSGGVTEILLTERGTCFGYNQLIADVTAIPLMQSLGCPVAFDATHIVRRYGIPSDHPEGGAPELVPVLARAGVAAGADALFVETHPEPRSAQCDAASMLPLDDLEPLLKTVLSIADAIGSRY